MKISKQTNIHIDNNSKPHKVYLYWEVCFKNLIANKNMRVVKNTFKYCNDTLETYKKFNVNRPPLNLLTPKILIDILKKHPDLMEYFI